MAGVIVPPRICSGLAYSGVIGRASEVIVESPSVPEPSHLEMPKSSSLTSPSAVTSTLPGFQIAMNDLTIVRMLHGVEHGEAQPHAVPDVQSAIVGIAIDRRAGDVLHHEVRQSLRRGPAIEEARNMRMVQGREHLPLVTEAADDEVRVHAAADHLDGDRMREIAGMVPEVDRAHAAASEAAVDHVRADRAADMRVVLVVFCRRVDGRGRDEQTRIRLGGEQRLDFRAQLRIAGAVRIEHGGALVRAPLRERARGPL